MRRSKSNPAKYAKNYRSISQRRMTADDGDDEQEMERLRNILKGSASALEEPVVPVVPAAAAAAAAAPFAVEGILSAEMMDEYGSDEMVVLLGAKKKSTSSSKTKNELPTLTPLECKQAAARAKSAQRKLQQLQDRAARKRKRAGLYESLAASALAPSTLRLLHRTADKLGHKQVATKRQRLQQLRLRQRAGLPLSASEQDLLYGHSSFSFSHPQQQQQQQQQSDTDDEEEEEEDEEETIVVKSSRNKSISTGTGLTEDPDSKPAASLVSNSNKQSDNKKPVKKKKKKKPSLDDHEDSSNDKDERSYLETKQSSRCTKQQQECEKTDERKQTSATKRSNSNDYSQTPSNAIEQEATSDHEDDEDSKVAAERTTVPTTKPPATAAAVTGLSLAAQMMASLTTLKKESALQSQQAATKEREEAERKRIQDEESKPKLATRYVPTNPIQIKTTQSYSKPTTKVPAAAAATTNKYTMIREVQRPLPVTAVRYDLPVAAMEFEVMDAVQNHDVTILCSETGSGKSTQVPQFLYEAGLSRSAAEMMMQAQKKKNCSDGDGGKATTIAAAAAAAAASDTCGCIIGVTQPRRVAAVSTAKRVCYEMGQGSGQSIPSNNLVAYQTRYETAGLGRNTHIKFMTDGILLQEIQTDLILRKYSVIVLDEAHERNLNTDVLIGLLSVALPLRKQACAESGLPPLKIIIMSATLRVEDFTGGSSNNNKSSLFSSTIPAVVKVPGRTHPVTIHHSKVTELDDYEDAAFKKTCKIHRQLPEGGILMFVTGKQEIIRMVNRLRRALSQKDRRRPNSSVESDVALLRDQSVAIAVESGVNAGGNYNNMPRDMDDDEVDGDLFQSAVGPDDFDDAEDDDVAFGAAVGPAKNDGDDAIPQKAIILPLYSLLSTEEQAQVFAPVPEGYRLIVVATNIAETSITIPGVTYVVDSGRQKCRNYNADTGVASFDIMWISKAAADQRAGRAGRTGPGHCYRLYSSSLYSRHMDAFSLPEVLTRPLEDVVLAMKAMKISNVSDFPFPTPPNRSQVDAAAKLLANIGCVDLSKVEDSGGDGEITRLGSAVSKLPLGVRYGKILLVAAEAGVLDYAIPIVAALSESNPFVVGGQSKLQENDFDSDAEEEPDDERTSESKKARSQRWSHKNGDVLAAMLAVGGYTFAGRGAGGASEKLACKKFCEENGLHHVVMERIQKMRSHLARLSMTRLGNAEGVAARTGGFVSSMPPPNKLQESLLCQSIASGLLDNIVMLAPLGSIPGQHPFSLRSAYLSCSSTVKEPLFIDRNSVLYSRDARQLPQWICFETLIRKTLQDGTSVAIMKNITPIDPSWLGRLAEGSRLLTIGEPLPSPLPVYDTECDAIMCSVKTKFGSHGWEIPPVKKEMFYALQTTDAKQSSNFMIDDSFRWFGRYLFEGKVFPEMKGILDMLNDNPSTITRQTPVAKVALLVSALSGAGVDSAAALRKHWAEVDSKFLFGVLKRWIKDERSAEFKKLWISCVKDSVRLWKEKGGV